MANRKKKRKVPKKPAPVSRYEKRRKIVRKAPSVVLPFGKINRIFLWTGVIMILAGFLLLAVGEATVCAVLMVLGYVVFLPLGLVYSRKPPPSKERLVEEVPEEKQGPQTA